MEQIFRAARQSGTHAFVVEAGSPPRWVSEGTPFALQDEVQSDVLTAFLFRTMPASSQARLAMGQPVEFCAQVQGDEWALRAESTEIGFFVHATPIQSIEESMSHCPVGDDEDEEEGSMADTGKFSEVGTHAQAPGLPPPPLVKTSQNQDYAPLEDDDFDQIQFQHRPSTAAGLGDAQAPGANDPGFAGFEDAGVPGYVEDLPFGVASGAISLGYPQRHTPRPGSSGEFEPVGSLMLARTRSVMELCVEHLQAPAITVKNESSLFDSYEAIETLEPGACVSVAVEDPSVWFSWIMRRLEQGCSVVVLCRAQDELGALRVLCGLNPELPTARWLAEHRRVFLADAAAVSSLFSRELHQVAG